MACLSCLGGVGVDGPSALGDEYLGLVITVVHPVQHLVHDVVVIMGEGVWWQWCCGGHVGGYHGGDLSESPSATVEPRGLRDSQLPLLFVGDRSERVARRYKNDKGEYSRSRLPRCFCTCRRE